jgi:hypothetical protein
MKRGLALLALGLAACSPNSGQQFDTTLNIQQVMKHVIDPAAIALWGRAGSVSDAAGEKDLAPIDEATWRAAENEAAVVAEGGNLLLVPQRTLKLDGTDGEWRRLAHKLTREALAIKKATADRNTQEMFDAGGRLYEVCTECHDRYYTPFLDADGKLKPNAPKPEAR